MNFENTSPEPTINDFHIQLNTMMSKWTTEGNKDEEPSLAMNIRMQVEAQKITPKEGIWQLYNIDKERIER